MLLWVGHESDCFNPTNNTNSETNTYIDGAAYGRAGVSVASVAARSSPDFAPQDEVWCKFSLGSVNAGGDGTAGNIPFWLENAAGQAVARLRLTGGNTWQAEVWNGVGYTALGAAPIAYAGNGGANRYHCHFKAGAAGVFQLWWNAALIIDQAGNFATSGGQVVRAGYSYTRTGVGATVSHAVIKTTSTLNTICEAEFPTSDGTDTTAVGGYTEVDELAFNDADFSQFANAGDRRSYKAGARTQTQAKVEGVTASCRAFYEPGGVTSVKPYLKIGGVRYYGTTFALGLTAKGYQYTWEQNPATGLPWTVAEANDAALEWGWEAV